MDELFEDNDDWDEFQESTISVVEDQHPQTLESELSNIFPLQESSEQGSISPVTLELFSSADDIRFAHWTSCKLSEARLLTSLGISVASSQSVQASPVQCRDRLRLGDLSMDDLMALRSSLKFQFESLSHVLVRELSAKDTLLQEKVRSHQGFSQNDIPLRFPSFSRPRRFETNLSLFLSGSLRGEASSQIVARRTPRSRP
jgi:hypothetical protein